jgi:predicted ATPase/class 3 adenylate cyclase
MQLQTLTFLFTDIEGSTRLWEIHPEAMRLDMTRHDLLLRTAVSGRGGEVVKGTGDGVLAAFSVATDALRAAIDVQRALAAEAWSVPGGIRVRMGIHSGEAERRDGDYYGTALNRAARLMGIAHGGQTLVSAAAAALVRDSLPDGIALRDLGLHPLRDLLQPEQVFQADAPPLPTEFPPIRSGKGVPTRLPSPLTSFVGREREIAALIPLVERTRLVTLIGPGGAGKTRLSLRLAFEVLDGFPDGVFFVDLAGLGDGSLVPAATAQGVGVREEAGTPVAATLARQLRDKRMLVILDNCEHLVDACARLADGLLRDCARLSLLATSREALGVGGETLFPVPSLGLPAGSTVSDAESVRLFAERAEAVAPGFRVTDDNAAAVAEICRRLDGIPLAIELAAARVRVLSPAEIARRLDDRFALLTAGGRTALPRQQTLRALIDWSHQLLGGHERILFRRLAVFSGGFGLTAAEAVCSSAGGEALDVLDLISQLVGKSLLVAGDDGQGGTRYRMLDTLRAFAREQLVAFGEEAALRSAHLGWCRSLCLEAEPELIGAHQREWFDRLAVEHDNLRAAIAWGLEASPREALEIVKALFWFWQARGHQGEGRAWTDAALAHPSAAAADALRQGALLAAGSLAWVAGEHAAADRQLAESADIAHALGDTRARAIALSLLGHTRVFAGHLDGARQVLDEALRLARAVDEPYPLARVLGSLGDLARAQGDDDALVRIADEAFATFSRIDMSEGMAFNLAYASWGLRTRDPTEARARLARALVLFDRVDHPYGLAFGLLVLLHVLRPPAATCARLLGAMDLLLERSSMPHQERDARMVAELRATVRAELGGPAFDAAVAEGYRLARGELLAIVMALLRGPD